RAQGAPYRFRLHGTGDHPLVLVTDVVDDPNVRSGSLASFRKCDECGRFAPESRHESRHRFASRWATRRHGIYRFLFASGLAISRACSMNSRATGLSVRFLRVTMPSGTRATGSSTGTTLTSGSVGGNLNMEVGKIDR